MMTSLVPWIFVTLFVLSCGPIKVANSAFRRSTVISNYEYRYYAGNGDEVGWCEAGMACKTNHPPGAMDIAIINTKKIDEQVQLKLLDIDNYPVTWIGGTYIYTHAWHWADGSSFADTYSGWCDGEPKESEEASCAQTTYCWDNWNCASLAGYICQLDLSKVTSDDFSDFMEFESGNGNAVSEAEAKQYCEKLGARLAVVKDEKRHKFVLKKLKARSFEGPYWIEKEKSSSQCYVINVDGLEERNCDDDYPGFLCETAEPNMLKVSDENPTVFETSHIQINCEASGIPSPDVGWYKDGELVTNQLIGKANSTLWIENATIAQSGWYSCVASNTINGNVLRSSGVSVVTVIPQDADEF